MKIKTDPKLPPVASKPHPLPLKHYKFFKEEIENLLKAGLTECSMSGSIKSEPGALWLKQIN